MTSISSGENIPGIVFEYIVCLAQEAIPKLLSGTIVWIHFSLLSFYLAEHVS